MPFGDVFKKQVYERGYTIGIRQHTLTTWQQVLREVERVYDESELHEIFMNGLESGFSNRQGEAIASRKAAWYQKNKARIVARQRKQRRQARQQAAHDALKHFTKSQNHE